VRAQVGEEGELPEDLFRRGYTVAAQHHCLVVGFNPKDEVEPPALQLCDFEACRGATVGREEGTDAGVGVVDLHHWVVGLYLR
jgi:hypothetical protein